MKPLRIGKEGYFSLGKIFLKYLDQVEKGGS
ncbi:hypothetical protein PEDI_12610 [Persicobacter diffluens]|uniref:Uncharacterized protein n=1 Tax=Persicobacter diffluens TaxID=981 RepID=A0AAN4VWW1_9BACT|nr:hypothetical protein PEDI_12610 [Persicobacter diffluens]